MRVWRRWKRLHWWTSCLTSRFRGCWGLRYFQPTQTGSLSAIKTVFSQSVHFYRTDIKCYSPVPASLTAIFLSLFPHEVAQSWKLYGSMCVKAEYLCWLTLWCLRPWFYCSRQFPFLLRAPADALDINKKLLYLFFNLCMCDCPTFWSVFASCVILDCPLVWRQILKCVHWRRVDTVDGSLSFTVSRLGH